jgi:hypothetical protein
MRNLERKLTEAYRFFYPPRGQGFRPAVVDFFSVLSAYTDIAKGLPGGLSDSADLGDELRFAIVQILCQRLGRATDDSLRAPHQVLDRIINRGNIVITTNWDTLIERAASARGLPYRLNGTQLHDELLVLKLHGSIDWLLRKDATKHVHKKTYGSLRELYGSTRASPKGVSDDVIRTRVSNPGSAWRTIKNSTKQPLMVMMAPGKGLALEPLLELWESAYKAIGSASRLEIIGYSMPEDDVEIRTLLRAGVQRGSKEPKLVVRNPDADVHTRVRDLIHDSIESVYLPVESLGA